MCLPRGAMTAIPAKRLYDAKDSAADTHEPMSGLTESELPTEKPKRHSAYTPNESEIRHSSGTVAEKTDTMPASPASETAATAEANSRPPTKVGRPRSW